MKFIRNKFLYPIIVFALVLAGYFYFTKTTHQEEPSIPPQFKNFPVSEIYKGTPAPADLASSPIGHTFRTILTEEAKTGPNFAGHYTVVEWGCGSECQNFAIVDAITGKIYSPSFPSENGQEFDLNSRLIVINPLANIRGYDGSVADWARIKYYEWTGTELKLLAVYRVFDNKLVEASLSEGDPSIPDWAKQSESCETVGGKIFCKSKSK